MNVIMKSAFVVLALTSILSPGKTQRNRLKPMLDESYAVQFNRRIRYNCPEPFQLISGSCLHFFAMREETWKSSRNKCWTLDSDLPVIKDQQRLLQLLVGYMKMTMDPDDMHWIGAKRRSSSSVFRWLDGSPLPDVSSPLWEYVDDNDRNCVAIVYSKRAGSFVLSNFLCKEKDFDMWTACQYS